MLCVRARELFGLSHDECDVVIAVAANMPAMSSAEVEVLAQCLRSQSHSCSWATVEGVEGRIAYDSGSLPGTPTGDALSSVVGPTVLADVYRASKATGIVCRLSWQYRIDGYGRPGMRCDESV